MNRHKVVIGEEFEARELDVTQSSKWVEVVPDVGVVREVLRHRRYVWALCLTIVPFLGALAVAALLGWLDGSFDELETVWTSVSHLLRRP